MSCSGSFCKSPIPTSREESETSRQRRNEGLIWTSWARGAGFQDLVRASQLIAPGLGTYAVRTPFLLEKIDLKCLGRERPEASSPRSHDYCGQPAESLLKSFNQVAYRKTALETIAFTNLALKRKDLVALFRKKLVILLFDSHAQRRP